MMKSKFFSEFKKPYKILLGYSKSSIVHCHFRQETISTFDHIIQSESSLGHELQSQIEAWFFQDTFLSYKTCMQT